MHYLVELNTEKLNLDRAKRDKFKEKREREYIQMKVVERFYETSYWDMNI
jgi:hypothetical protein